MINISLLWTIDRYDSFLSNNLSLLDIPIGLVCSARSYSSIKTAELISRDLYSIKSVSNKKRQSISDEEFYTFPYITTTPDYTENSEYSGRRPKVLSKIDNYPDYHTCNYQSFEDYVIPYIKNLIWTKYKLYKTFSYTSNEYNVIMVSDQPFLEKIFGVVVQGGTFLKQTFYFDTSGKIIPYYKGITKPENIPYRKEGLHSSNLKIFLK